MNNHNQSNQFYEQLEKESKNLEKCFRNQSSFHCVWLTEFIQRFVSELQRPAKMPCCQLLQLSFRQLAITILNFYFKKL